MKKFTVKRSKWARGGMNGHSRLLNIEGCMCCLGFATNQISRIPKDKLANRSCPEDVFEKQSTFTTMDSKCVVDNELSINAININDDRILTEKMREKRLTELFRKHKINVKFVD